MTKGEARDSVAVEIPQLSPDFPLNTSAQAIHVTPTSSPTVYKADLKRDWCIGLGKLLAFPETVGI